MDDLVSRLTAAIDKHELDATEEDTDPVFGGYAGSSWHTRACGLWQGETQACQCDVPAVVHRGCAADRKVLARHETKILRCVVHADSPHEPDCFDCAYCDNQYWPCPDLRDLADRYGIPV